MSHNFDVAMKDLMYWEGGGKYHRVRGDLGGATKFGISLRFLKNLPLNESDIDRDGHVTERDIELLTEAKAYSFYLKHFWTHYKLRNIEQTVIASKLLNIFVNMRGRTAGRVAQRALASCGCFEIVEDGFLGPISFDAINDMTCTKELLAMYLAALRSEQSAIYRLICAHNPQQQMFLAGWLRRARDHRY